MSPLRPAVPGLFRSTIGFATGSLGQSQELITLELLLFFALASVLYKQSPAQLLAFDVLFPFMTSRLSYTNPTPYVFDAASPLHIAAAWASSGTWQCSWGSCLTTS